MKRVLLSLMLIVLVVGIAAAGCDKPASSPTPTPTPAPTPPETLDSGVAAPITGVEAAVSTVTITPTAKETGTVSSDNDKDNSRTRAGDDEKNIGYCALWSFDIWSLQEKKIQSASLKFTTTSVVGDPFPSTTGLGGLWLWKVTYGDTLPKFRYLGNTLQSVGLQSKPPSMIDVTTEISHLAASAIERFQVEALFNKVANGNGVAEWVEWSEVVLEVTYSEK